MNDVLQRLYETRPRLLRFRLEVGRFRLRWLLPLWVLEELLLFALRLAIVLAWSSRYARTVPVPGFLPSLSVRDPLSVRNPLSVRDHLPICDHLGLEHLLVSLTPERGLLRLPGGEAYLSLETSDFTLELSSL